MALLPISGRKPLCCKGIEECQGKAAPKSFSRSLGLS
jgi:hypothetical protein